MSATSNYWVDVMNTLEAVDQATYGAGTEICTLANLAWGKSTTEPIWAPDAEWIEETARQLKFMQNCLEELRMARSCMDAKEDGVTVNN